MKIKILTLPFNWNYGGILQNFALQYILIKEGHVVETINRENISGSLSQLLKSIVSRAIKKFLFRQKIKLRMFPDKKDLSIICENTNNFVNENIKISPRAYNDQDLKKIKEEKFDAIIVGSDQIWRPKYSNNINNHFLEFLNGHSAKRISYASSLGSSQWEFNKVQTTEVKNLIQKFDAISVREQSGAELLQKHFNSKAQNTLDPTLLVPASVYESIASKNISKIPENGLMTYILDGDEKKKELVQTCADKHNLEPFTCRQKKYFHNMGDDPIDDCVAPPIEQWIDSFRKAKFIITDSYHGMIFSIIFNKPFIALANVKRGLSRFESLLKSFNIEDRLVTNIDAEAVRLIDEKIDYDRVNERLNKLRTESINFLLDSLAAEHRD